MIWGATGPRIESFLGHGDVRTGLRGVSSGSSTPTPFLPLVFSLPKGPLTTIPGSCASPPRSVTSRCHTPLCQHSLIVTPEVSDRMAPPALQGALQPHGEQGVGHACADRISTQARPTPPQGPVGAEGACAGARHHSSGENAPSGWPRQAEVVHLRAPCRPLSISGSRLPALRSVGQPRIGVLT